jgi:hypothetical protein
MVDATSSKISRSHLGGSGRGGWFNYRLIHGLNQPPRLRELMWLREVFLIAQPPLLPPRRGLRLTTDFLCKAASEYCRSKKEGEMKALAFLPGVRPESDGMKQLMPYLAANRTTISAGRVVCDSTRGCLRRSVAP